MIREALRAGEPVNAVPLLAPPLSWDVFEREIADVDREIVRAYAAAVDGYAFGAPGTTPGTKASHVTEHVTRDDGSWYGVPFRRG